MSRNWGYIGAAWALVGIILLLGSAIIRLYPYAMELQEFQLTAWQWTALITFTLFMLVAEGYRGFQKQFSPRFAARTLYLTEQPTILRILLAPFFSIGYFHAQRRIRVMSISITSMVVILVLLVRTCPQPWRGVIDVGVIVGLIWGLISTLVMSFLALIGRGTTASAQMPAHDSVHSGG